MKEISYEFVDTNNPLGINNCIIQLRTVYGHTSDTAFHWHDAVELTLVLEGEIQYISQGARHTAGSGELVFINSGDIHLTENTSPTSRTSALVVLIPDQFVKELMPEFESPNFQIDRNPSARKEIITLMAGIVQHLESTDRFRNLLLRRELISIVYSLFTYCYAGERSSFKHQHLSRFIVKYVSDHYREPLTVEEIASVAGLQKNYFCRLFRRETGFSFHQYLCRIRLNSTLALYTTGQSTLLECALQSGFANEKSAFEWCRKIYHCTPLEYRRASMNNR